jgi:hypothetical protein
MIETLVELASCARDPSTAMHKGGLLIHRASFCDLQLSASPREPARQEAGSTRTVLVRCDGLHRKAEFGTNLHERRSKAKHLNASSQRSA